MYVYVRSKHENLWTVGFFRPDNNAWEAESDHDSDTKAAERVAWLNGAEKTLSTNLYYAAKTILNGLSFNAACCCWTGGPWKDMPGGKVDMLQKALAALEAK